MYIIARIGLMLGLVLALSNARAIEVKLPFVGQLSESGALVNGTKTMRFQTVDAPGTIRYETGPLSIPVSNGAFSVVLGGTNQPALDSSVFTAFGLKLHVLVEDISLSPDLDVPFSAYAANAISAKVADLFDGHDSTEFARLGEHNIFNAGQTFQPTTDSSSLLVRQSSAPSPTSDIFHVQNSDGSATHFSISSSGQISWPGLAAGSISGNAATASIADLFDGHDSHDFALVGEQNIFTAGQIFRPALDASSVIVRQTSADAPTRDIFSVESADSTQSYLRISSVGQLIWPGIALGSIAGNAATATDAGKLNGRPGTFYNEAANLTGTISDDRLSPNVMRVDEPQTFTATKTFQSATDNPSAIVRQTSVALPTSDIFQVENLDSTTSYLRISSSGQLSWMGTAQGSISGNAGTANDAGLFDGHDSTEFARLGEHNIFNAGQTFQPTTDSSSLLVRQSLATSPTSDIFHVQNADGSATHFSISSSGQISWPGLAAGSISGNAATATSASQLNGHHSHEFALVGAQNIFTAGQIFRPILDTSSVVVRQSSFGSPTRDIFSVESADSTQSYFRINNSGQPVWPGIAQGSISGNAATATDAGKLNGRPGTFYNDAANLTGTIADAHLSPHVPLKNATNVFTGGQVIESANGTVKGLVIKGALEQSTNLQEWQNDAGEAVASLDGEGALKAASVAIDADLQMAGGKAGLGREALVNTLEVAGEASKDIAGLWAANSDRRIKTDVETITNALETLDNVRLVSFRYTDEYRAGHPSIEGRRYMNVLAQEFQKVFPDNVKGSGEKLANGEEILQVDTYPLTIYSAAAVQELHHQMKERDARIADLEKTVAELKKLVSLLAGSK